MSKPTSSASAASAAASVAAPSVWSEADRKALQTFLTKELSKVVKNADYLTKLTTGPALDLWTVAFTHSSMNAVPGQNYEGFETVGDKYLGAFFVSYVDTILPREERTPSYYTELVRHWLKKANFALFATELTFPQYGKILPEILNDPDPETKEGVYEDLFEAFFGALVTIGDTLIRDMVGTTYAKAYLFQFMKTKNILLPEEEIFPVKTKLKELFDGLRWGDVRYFAVGKASDPQVTIAVLDHQGDRLAVGYGRDRKQAETDAAANAIKVLAKQGLTPASIAAQKPVDREICGLEQRVSRYLAKYGKYGPMEYARVFKESKKNGRILVELRTIQDFGTPKAKKIALGRAWGAQDRLARIAALQEYMNTHNIQ